MALTYAEYLNGYVGDGTVDGSGNTYVTGQNTSGVGVLCHRVQLGRRTVVYNANVGTSTIYPFRVRVDSSGKAYVAGYPTPRRCRPGPTRTKHRRR